MRSYYSIIGQNKQLPPPVPSHLRPLGVGIQVDTSVLEAELEGMEANTRDLSPWLSLVWSPWVKESFKKQLLSQGTWMGVGSLWSVEYSERYEKWKQAFAGHTRREWLSGDMFRALYEGEAESITATTGVIGTELLYSGVQQGSYPESMRGTPTRLGKHSASARSRRPSERAITYKRKIPIRPPWGHVKEAWMLQLTESLLDYAVDGKITPVKP